MFVLPSERSEVQQSGAYSTLTGYSTLIYALRGCQKNSEFPRILIHVFKQAFQGCVGCRMAGRQEKKLLFPTNSRVRKAIQQIIFQKSLALLYLKFYPTVVIGACLDLLDHPMCKNKPKRNTAEKANYTGQQNLTFSKLF